MITNHIIVTDVEDLLERQLLEILSPKEKDNPEKEKIIEFIQKVKKLCKESL